MTTEDERYLNIIRMMQRVGKDLLVIRDRNLSEIGITSVQSSAILFIGSNPGCRITDLGKHRGISHQAARSLVERMCTKGFMCTKVCEDDARARKITLTRMGRETESRIRNRGGNVGKGVLTGFSDEDIASLEEYLNRIKDNIVKKDDH